MLVFNEKKTKTEDNKGNISIEKMKDDLNNLSHLHKEKHVELDSARKELGVKNKLILQLKTDLHGLKNGNADGVRKQQDMEKLTNRVHALTLECSSLQERNQMLS